MAEDLAIDVGLPLASEDYKRFVACVNAIMDHGCSYSDRTMTSIREYCEESELPFAKKVLRECDRIQDNTSRMRPSNLKWWETYTPRKEKRRYRDHPRESRNPKRHHEQKRRPMSLQFKKQKRPMSLKFDKKRRQTSSRREQLCSHHRYNKRGRSVSPDGRYQQKRRRPLSPVAPDVPIWPSRKRSKYDRD